MNRIELPAAMDPASERMLTRLKKLQGAQFDVAYMDHMVADHKKDVKEFEHEAKSDRQNEIKQFAADAARASRPRAIDAGRGEERGTRKLRSEARGGTGVGACRHQVSNALTSSTRATERRL